MSETPSTASSLYRYIVGTPSQSTAPLFDGNCAVTCFASDARFPTAEAARKEAKRKADHEHNLRLQKERRGEKVKPW